MFGNLWGRAVGLVAVLVGVGGMSVLVFTVIFPLVHAVLMPHTAPLVAPICPGAPPCAAPPR